MPRLTIDDLAAVHSKAWRARSKWYNIGLQLGLTADDLDCIRMDYHDTDSCFTEMLKQWLRQSIEKTWDRLIKALRSETVNYGALADSIIAAQGESATSWVDHDPTPEHCNISDNRQSNQYADHSAVHDQCTAMVKPLAIQKPKQRGFICRQCSIEQFLEAGVMNKESDPMIFNTTLTDSGIPSSLETSGHAPSELEQEFNLEGVQKQCTMPSLLTCARGPKSSFPAISQEAGSNQTALTVAVPSAEKKSDSEFVQRVKEMVGPEQAKRVLEWMRKSGLRIVVTGKTGVGKSTLLSTFLGFDIFAEGDSFDPVTTHVKEYKHNMRNGVKITVWDCSGLQDNSGYEDQYLEELKAKTKGNIHLMLYCINMLETRSDLHWGSAVDRITSILGKDIWNNTALVLTFANIYEMRLTKDQGMTSKKAQKVFNEKVKEWQKKFQEKLQSIDGISRSTIDELKVLAAGKDSHIPLFGNKDWYSELWIEMFTRVKPEAKKAVFRLNEDRFCEYKANSCRLF